MNIEYAGRIIVTTVCTMLAIATFAQAPAADPLASVVANMPKTAMTYRGALLVAADVEKAKGWDTVSGKAIIAAADTNAQAKKNMSDARLLIQGDVSGLVSAFTPSPAIAPSECEKLSQTLRELGFEVAANALMAIYATSNNQMGYLPIGEIQDGVMRWSSLPLDQVSALAPLIEKRFIGNPPRAREMYSAAWKNVRELSKEEMKHAAGIAGVYVLLGQKRGLTNTYKIRADVQPGNEGDIISALVAEELALNDPTNAWVVIHAAQLLRDLQQDDRALAVCQRGLATVPEPGLRDVRLAYIDG